jgi:hypothetical protein
MPAKPTILTLAEFLKLTGKQKGPVIVYFNANQWSNLTSDIKPGTGKPPDKTMTLTLTALPGLEGGLATFGCPIECSGPIRGGEGEVRCDCGGSLPTPGGGGGGGASVELCVMRVRRDGRASCVGTCRSGRTCRLTSWAVPSITGTRLLVSSCSCGR